MRGFLYILQSIKNNSYYIGSTENLEKRLYEHGSGRVSSTKKYLPWKLVFYKEYPTIKQARQVEYHLKKFKNKKITKNIIETGNILITP